MGNSPWLSNNLLLKIAQLFLITGFILCLGNISSFIAMNSVLGKTPSVTSIYWQRLFVTKITHMFIVPGLWLILSSTIILSWKEYGIFINWRISVFQTLVLITFINGIFIIAPMSEQVTTLSKYQMENLQILPEYTALKNQEDVFGIINFLMLICSLIFVVNKFFRRKGIEVL